VTIKTTERPGMAGWRKRLYVAMARNAASPADVFHLPADRTVTIGSAIDL
jgi:KUP system potassium uptake protein